jgi:hypothetical protein
VVIVDNRKEPVDNFMAVQELKSAKIIFWRENIWKKPTK